MFRDLFLPLEAQSPIPRQTALDMPEATNRTVLVGDAVAYAIGQEIGAFATAFDYGRSGDVFGENGLLSRYYTVCQELLEASQDTDDIELGDTYDWDLQCRTWDLIQRLYLERTKDDVEIPQPAKFVSNHYLEHYLYETDATAAEIKIVLDWLRDGARDYEEFENRGNRWFYTKESIKSRERQGKRIDEQRTITELDPDTPIRQGKLLVEEDANFERSLMKAMYARIRGGDFEQAAEIARYSGNHWRAASLQGCVEDKSLLLDGGEDDSEREGSSNKALWRRMCFALARRSNIDTYERAMYGALSGDISSVLPVCTSWEDRLWANYNAMNQSRVESFLREHNRVNFTGDFPIEDVEYSEPGIIFDGLLHSEYETIKEEAKLPMRIIQAHIMTRRIDDLLLDLQKQLLAVRSGGPPNAGSSPRILMFMTHFVLVLRQLNVPIPEDAANSILQAYVELLTTTDHGHIVALYASYLPEDMAIESLARHLARVEEEEARTDQLRLINSHGIQSHLTILRTVEAVFQELLDNLVPHDSLVPIKDELPAGEERCIRAFEWVNHDDSLQSEALMLGNTLFRKFLLNGRLNSARTLAERMPDSLLVPSDERLEQYTEADSNLEHMREIIEYVGHCAMVRALSRYEDWKSLSQQRPQEINGRRDPVGLRQWKTDLARVKSECIVMLRELLDGNIGDPSLMGIDEKHGKRALVLRCRIITNDVAAWDELSTLQIMYLPEVIMKLHAVYSAQEGRDVSLAMELAVVVADRYSEPMRKSGSLAAYVTEVSLLGSYLV